MAKREEKKAETSARLVRMARKMFFDHGYAGTSMDALCAAAGVTRGALYHNFGGKEGLFEAVIRQIDAEIGERLLGDAPDGPVTLDAFIGTCTLYLGLVRDPEIQKLVFTEAPPVLGQTLRDIDQQGSIGPLREAIAELQAHGILAAGDPDALAVMLNGAMIDAALWIARGEGTEHRLTAATAALDGLIRGLALGRDEA